MEVEVKPGKYVLAVSGGVDSMVLMDLLAKKPDVALVITHFNHGIREEADWDEEFVRQAAQRLGLPFEASYGRLGKGASEDAARQARYEFLYRVKKKYNALAIITAHHQDDLIETAFINLIRGTGRKGLVAILNNRNVLRPLTGYSKKVILAYAQKQGLKWREDSTNQDEAYLRNRVRQSVMPKLSEVQRSKIIENIDKVAEFSYEIDNIIATISHTYLMKGKIDRQAFTALPVSLGDELVAYWLRRHMLNQFSRQTVNRVGMALKTARADTVYPVQGEVKLLVSKKTAQFVTSYKQMAKGLL